MPDTEHAHGERGGGSDGWLETKDEDEFGPLGAGGGDEGLVGLKGSGGVQDVGRAGKLEREAAVAAG